MTVLFVEHDMHMVRHIADWVVVMAEGKIVAEGPPDTVMQNPAVIDAYLGSHQDVDLGVVTGRVPGELNTAAIELQQEVQEFDEVIEKTLHHESDASPSKTPESGESAGTEKS